MRIGALEAGGTKMVCDFNPYQDTGDNHAGNDSVV